MRKIVILILVFNTYLALGDHLLGGEISYKHKSATKYEVNITLYRDCAGSKMGGTGGGSSTSNHTDLKTAYLRTGQNSTCGDIGKNIGSVSLTKLGYEDITQICNSYGSSCASNSNYSYGIEAHHYRGMVDFDAFSAYMGCEIEIYISISDRATNLSTTEKGANFYNFALINPWIDHNSSPQFTEKPTILYAAGKPVFMNPLLKTSLEDSLSFKWATPLKGHNTTVSYTSGYSKEQFITPYCRSGENCNPDPNANIPEGIYLNTYTGNYAFTPANYGELGTMVLEIEQWRKLNGKAYKAGLIRRDIQVAVILQDRNNPPGIIADEKYSICVGQQLSFSVSALDPPVVLPDGTTLPGDSVQFNVYKSLSEINEIIYTTQEAPYRKIDFSLIPDESMVGIHYIYIEATDNNCPNLGKSYKSIQIEVNPLANIDVLVEDVFCGNNQLNLSSDQEGIAELTILDGTEQRYYNSDFKSDLYTDFTDALLRYDLRFTTDKSCVSKISKEIKNRGNAIISGVVVSGSEEYCASDMTEFTISHPDYVIQETRWIDRRTNTNVSSDTFLKVKAMNTTKYDIRYTLVNDNMSCELDTMVNIFVSPLPVVVIKDIPEMCKTAEIIDLNGWVDVPQGGIWEAENIEIKDNKLDITKLANEDQSIFLNYIVTDVETGCIGSANGIFKLKKSPEIKLKDIMQCGDNYNFRLVNSIVAPVHYSPENISWQIKGNDNAVLGQHPFAELDVKTLGVGVYDFIGTNLYSNGCISRDTATIRVDEALTLIINEKNTICQDSQAVNLNEFYEINAPGVGWQSSDADEWLSSSYFTPVQCGTYTFNYTYDAYGCYATTSMDLEVICKPELKFTDIEQLCVNSNPILLETPEGGLWSGPGIKGKSFNPRGLSGTQTLHMNINERGCNYSYVKELEVLEAVDLSLGDIPDKLCEGELLNLNYSKDNHSRISVQSCGTTAIAENGRISYQPDRCDLISGNINLKIKAYTFDHCPSLTKQVNIDYYPKPAVKELTAISKCWPYTIDQEFEIIQGIDPTLKYSLSSDNDRYSSSGKRMYYTFPQNGIYQLTVNMEDVSGCSNVQEFPSFVTVHPKPRADFGLNKQGYLDISERDLYFYNYSDIEEGELSYEWYYIKNGEPHLFSVAPNPSYILPVDTGYFRLFLKANSLFGCSDSAYKDLFLVPDVSVFIPTAFTPDNQGPEENNKFRVISLNAANIHIQVFNRWGQMVFESFDLKEGWDGTYRGKDADPGVYVYHLQIINKSGLEFRYQGTVNLLR